VAKPRRGAHTNDTNGVVALYLVRVPVRHVTEEKVVGWALHSRWIGIRQKKLSIAPMFHSESRKFLGLLSLHRREGQGVTP
jgi:hypothetical protein